LLLESGYLSNLAEFRNIVDFRNTSEALVTPHRGLPLSEKEEEDRIVRSLGRDLNP
jgi:hypothetical protein